MHFQITQSYVNPMACTAVWEMIRSRRGYHVLKALLGDLCAMVKSDRSWRSEPSFNAIRCIHAHATSTFQVLLFSTAVFIMPNNWRLFAHVCVCICQPASVAVTRIKSFFLSGWETALADRSAQTQVQWDTLKPQLSRVSPQTETLP